MDKFEQMVEAIEETEDMVECKECFDLFPKAECTKIAHGYICPTCGREQPRNLDDISFTDITTDLYSQEFPDVMDYDSEFKAKVEADREAAMNVDSVVDALIKDEYDAIEGYEVADEVVQHSDLEAEEKEDLLDTIDHIKEEEEEHIDELKDAADLEIKDLEDKKEDPEDEKDEDPKEETEEVDEALGVGAGLALGGAAIGAGMIGSKLLDSKESEEGAEDLDELFDTNLELGLDGGSGNKVDVLSSHEPEKEGEEKLDELFDTDIKLGLDAGDNNDVSVLSPLNASHDEEEEGEELNEDFTGTPEERTTHLDKEDSDKGTLKYDNPEKAEDDECDANKGILHSEDDKCILTEGPFDFFKNKKAVKALDKLFGASGYVLVPSDKAIIAKHKAELGFNSPFKTFTDAQAKAKAASQLFPEATLYIVPIVPSSLPAEVRDQMDIKGGKYGPILAAYLGGKENAADKNRKQIGLNLQKMLKAYEVFAGKDTDAVELPVGEEPRAEEAPAEETPTAEEPAAEEAPAVKTEANKKMKAALKAAGMSQADIDKLFKNGVIPTIRKALLGEGLTLEDLRDEETVVCGWCDHEVPKCDCRKEVDFGWLCDRCEEAIRSRGEELTFTEDLKTTDDAVEELKNTEVALKSAADGMKEMTGAMKEDIETETKDLTEAYGFDCPRLKEAEINKPGIAKFKILYHLRQNPDVQGPYGDCPYLSGFTSTSTFKNVLLRDSTGASYGEVYDIELADTGEVMLITTRGKKYSLRQALRIASPTTAKFSNTRKVLLALKAAAEAAEKTLNVKTVRNLRVRNALQSLSPEIANELKKAIIKIEFKVPGHGGYSADDLLEIDDSASEAQAERAAEKINKIHDDFYRLNFVQRHAQEMEDTGMLKDRVPTENVNWILSSWGAVGKIYFNCPIKVLSKEAQKIIENAKLTSDPLDKSNKTVDCYRLATELIQYFDGNPWFYEDTPVEPESEPESEVTDTEIEDMFAVFN